MGIEAELDGKIEAYRSATHHGALKIMFILASEEAGFTEIMFRSRLSPSVLNKLLKSLVRYGMIKKDDGKYTLTRKGELILERLLEIVELL
ncbi:winged helix-turn-helix domain-containing protein [Archaeoglobus neptunius]|uniref:winged helix-turn-helix domain-containing protein n=1 Tax=Archaeoglobus neptunius TaxID=2798580 RepID=UPI00192949DC|nr:winged helix-turn-helix domain-containing protein [Archaeoglobus neptunius]